MISPHLMASTSRHAEPTLDELLDEPIVQLIMKRDGVAPDWMRRHIAELATQEWAARAV
ncbi:MAG: hypothetical protein J0M34_06700 [Alphaproteobacteria bacterium]|nr:hypothetical protein [Alphaproteobacteria bacterium]